MATYDVGYQIVPDGSGKPDAYRVQKRTSIPFFGTLEQCKQYVEAVMASQGVAYTLEAFGDQSEGTRLRAAVV